MKFKRTIAFLLLIPNSGFAQNQLSSQQNNRKGKLFFYWGWNREGFTKSDINFRGANYNFTLKNVVAKDRQSKFDLKKYFNPSKATIPQYNFRIGYFITNHYSISFGIDHMKYVVQQGQVVKLSGNISSTGTVYDNAYTNEDITINPDFLQFEHTNGLNYINLEFRRFDEMIDLNKIKINLTEGLGAGILFPKTNATLLNNESYDEFHLSGYGINEIVGINISFFKSLFVQTEFKGGFLNMPDIRTTIFESDRASQNFFFYQLNIVFGATINLLNNKT